jgi:hypothetical protein
VLYHLARLMHKTRIEQLEKHRPFLISTTEKLLETEQNAHERRYLETAFMKFSGQLPKPTSLKLNNTYKPFFIAGFLSGFDNQFIKFFAKKTIFQINWRSEALDLTLELENLVLKNQLNKV